MSLFAGAVTEAGAIDGQGDAARFDTPVAIAVDRRLGTIYVADSGNHTIRRITAAGSVSTFAGAAGKAGFVDGAGAAARFNDPAGLDVDASGAVYVVDRGNFAVRRIDASGNVTTLAGGGRPGTEDGPGTSASFLFASVAAPTIVVDRSSNALVADGYGIRRITPDGNVTTVAGRPNEGRVADGQAAEARFGEIHGIAPDAAGNIFVAHGAYVRRVGTDGFVSTFANLGTGDPPAFAGSLVIDADGNLYAADWNRHVIVRISPQGVVSPPVGGSGRPGVVDGPRATATLDRPAMALTPDGNLLLSERFHNVVRQLDLGSGEIRTLAGRRRVLLGEIGVDGIGAAARFGFIAEIKAGPDGALYAADGKIRRISLAGEVGTVATTLRTQSLAVDTAGVVYVPETQFCGDSVSRTSWPCGLKFFAVRPGSTNLLRDFGSRGLVPGGLSRGLANDFYMAVTEYQGSPSILRFDAGGPIVVAWAGPASGVAVDGAGSIFWTDAVNHVVRRMTATGVASVIAGRIAEPGDADGIGEAARFDMPTGLALDDVGNVYVADFGNHLVRKVTPAGLVSTVAGTRGSRGFVGGNAPGVLAHPVDVAVVGRDLFIAMSSSIAVVRNRP